MQHTSMTMRVTCTYGFTSFMCFTACGRGGVVVQQLPLEGETAAEWRFSAVEHDVMATLALLHNT